MQNAVEYEIFRPQLQVYNPFSRQKLEHIFALKNPFLNALTTVCMRKCHKKLTWEKYPKNFLWIKTTINMLDMSSIACWPLLLPLNYVWRTVESDRVLQKELQLHPINGPKNTVNTSVWLGPRKGPMWPSVAGPGSAWSSGHGPIVDPSHSSHSDVRKRWLACLLKECKSLLDRCTAEVGS